MSSRTENKLITNLDIAIHSLFIVFWYKALYMLIELVFPVNIWSVLILIGCATLFLWSDDGLLLELGNLRMLESIALSQSRATKQKSKHKSQ